MTLKALKQFFKPEWNKACIFVIFMFIAFAGHTQTWAFSGKDLGEPKPPLYDLLKPFPFWILWVFLLLPIVLLSNLIVTVAGYDADFIERGPFWLTLIIQLVYFYTASCLIIFIWNKLIGK